MAAPRAVRLNNDTNLLKLIAIASMLIDHAGARLFPYTIEFRQIGRLAFPIFAYSMAAGCVYTRSIGKYALRVLVFAVLVQPLYGIAMGHAPAGFDWAGGFYRIDRILETYYAGHYNILFSLGAGILAIWLIRDGRFELTALLAAILFVFSDLYDYGINGVILMVLLYAFIDRPAASAVAVGLFMLYMGAPLLFTRAWHLRAGAPFTAEWFGSVQGAFRTQIYALFALPLIYVPKKTRMKLNKSVFYAFYPAHLALIHVARTYCLDFLYAKLPWR